MRSRKASAMLSEEARLIEVVLFIENEPTSMERLCDLTNLRPDTVEDALQELRENYAERGSGLILTEEDELYSFMPAPDLFPQLRQSYGRKVDRRLSRAAMETLAIVAYGQPITRREIEEIRGEAPQGQGVYNGQRKEGCSWASLSVLHNKEIPL